MSCFFNSTTDFDYTANRYAIKCGVSIMNGKDIGKYWSIPCEKVMQNLQSSSTGLSDQEAKIRLKEYGENTIKKQKKATKLMLFLKQLKSPIMLILIFGTIVSAITGDLTDASIIIAIILGSSLLSFSQEYRASNAIEELRAKVQIKSIVLRSGIFEELPARMIVPGDVLKFSAGSFISVDGLVLEASDFSVNQSILTGEALPAERNLESFLNIPVRKNVQIAYLWVQLFVMELQ